MVVKPMADNAALLDEIYERALGERAVACKNWIWGAGMLVSLPPAEGSEKRQTRRLMDGETINTKDGVFPVLRDASTRGCLLAIVRRAYNSEIIVIRTMSSRNPKDRQGWKVISEKVYTSELYFTESEALVAALESAP